MALYTKDIGSNFYVSTSQYSDLNILSTSFYWKIWSHIIITQRFKAQALSSNLQETFVKRYRNNFLKPKSKCLLFGHSNLLYFTLSLIIKLFYFDLKHFVQVKWTILISKHNTTPPPSTKKTQNIIKKIMYT